MSPSAHGVWHQCKHVAIAFCRQCAAIAKCPNDVAQASLMHCCCRFIAKYMYMYVAGASLALTRSLAPPLLRCSGPCSGASEPCSGVPALSSSSLALCSGVPAHCCDALASRSVSPATYGAAERQSVALHDRSTGAVECQSAGVAECLSISAAGHWSSGASERWRSRVPEQRSA